MEMLETLLEGVRSACAAFPDKRRGDVKYSMADIGLSAFSLFFMQSAIMSAGSRKACRRSGSRKWCAIARPVSWKSDNRIVLRQARQHRNAPKHVITTFPKAIVQQTLQLRANPEALLSKLSIVSAFQLARHF